MTYLLSFPIPSFEFLLKMTFRVMTKVMTNLIKPRNLIVIQSVNENVTPFSYLRNLKRPEELTLLVFFFVLKSND